MWLRCGELPHGHGLLHDDLVFAAVLVPKISYFVPELRYEGVIVGVYPFVLPVVYPSSIPCVQVDVYTTIVFLFMLQGPASHPLADGALGHPELAGCFLDGESVYPSSIPFVHTRDTRPLGVAMKGFRRQPRGSQQGQVSVGIRGLSYASPGTRFSSELDLLEGGRDRWTG